MRNLWVGCASFLAGIVFVCFVVFLYLRVGPLPVAVKDAPFPLEKQIVHVPLNARIERDAVNPPSAQMTYADLVAGAGIYRERCAFCHGLPSQSSPLAQNMFPSVPQLWSSHRSGVVGVSDDPVGETFWKVKNGIRLSGMPAYGTILSEREMWQVSTLLSQADKPMGADVKTELEVQSTRSHEPCP